MWRLWFLAVVACSGDNTHQSTTPPTPPVVVAPPDAAPAAPLPPAGPAPAPLSEAMAAPYFATGPAADGARAFALEKWAEAKAGFEAARAAKGATADDLARLELMLGLVHARLGEWTKAAERLAAAAKGVPLLADYVRYQTARAYYFAANLPKALELARAVARDSIVGADAELLVGDVLRAAPAAKIDAKAVAVHYQDYLTRRPEGLRRSEARFRLAEALEQTKAEPKEYVALYRRIGIDDPLSSWAKQAAARLAALKKSLPAELAAYDTLTATELVAKGKELFNAQRNPESEAAFEAALADKAITPEERCVAAYHRGQSRFKARDRKAAAPMFDEAAAACKDAKTTDLEVKSLYQAGRSWSFIGQHETATKRYQAAQVVDAAHSYADDALLREGEEWAARGDAKKVEEVLASLPVKFPKGDNLAEAMWRLGWAAWQAKSYDAAIKWWTKQIELVPHDDNYYGEGQAQYWLARAYAVKGQKVESLAAYEAAVRTFPAAYYAMLALNRLREADPKRADALIAEVSADPPGFDPKAPVFAFQPRPDWGTPGFQRALELLRLGLGDPAEAELRKLGLTAPPDKKRVDDPDKIDKLWAMAFLFDRAGRYPIAHWPTRWHILDYRKQWPVGANRARWQIGYPRAYEALLRTHAATNKVPYAMQTAIVREESSFNPLLESTANAIGLTQMIFVTGERFAKGTGFAATRENLRDPEKNVTIGSRFLGYLFTYWKNFTMLVPPSYNAGEGYTRRAMKKRGTLDADEFVEAILDDEIRNYTKRVLGTYFTYSWLYDKTVPVMPNTIPKDLIPK